MFASRQTGDAMKTIPKEDLNKILCAARNRFEQDSQIAARDYIMVRMALLTGLRASEIVSLIVGDIRHKDGTIRQAVPLRIYKGHGGDQTIYLQSSLRGELQAWCADKQDQDPLFPNSRGQQMTRQGLHYVLKRICSEAGVDNYSPHTFRHTCATRLIENGTNLRVVQKILRHADIRTTTIYTHPSSDRCIEAIEGLD